MKIHPALIALTHAAAILASAVAARAAEGETAGRRPNILFVLTDDQRWDAMSCMGNPMVRTPNMDRLAEQGVLFENAFVTTSICAASRASIFTGQFERTHGYTFNRNPLSKPAMAKSYPALLRSAGYRTGFVGKFGIGVERGSTDAMFDFFKPLNRNPYIKTLPDGSKRHLTRITGDEAVKFLEGCNREQPFCLSVSFNAPHAEDSDPKQYIFDPAHGHLYNDATVPIPKLADPRYFEMQPDFIKKSTNRDRWYWKFDTPEKFQEMVKGYYRMITGIDDQLGRMQKELKRLGFADNTVVIFTSDNGYFLGERGFAGKWLMYERSIRVPLLVFDPRSDAARRGVRLTPLVLNIDIPSTILELAAVGIPKRMQGRSLLPLVEGEKVPWRDDFFYEHLFGHRGHIPRSEGVRTEDWKYVRYFDQKPLHEQLYNLQTDPDEVDNLTDDARHRQTLDKLRRRCDELRDSVGGPFVLKPRTKKPARKKNPR